MNRAAWMFGGWLAMVAGLAGAGRHVDTHVHLDQAAPSGFSTAGFGEAA